VDREDELSKDVHVSARAIEIADDRRLTIVERSVPEPGPGEVEIEVAYCGICGSDLHFRDIPALFPSGTVPGHEFSGAISAVGEGASNWKVGDRVSVLPFAQCGQCELCLSGEEQVCPHAVANGVGLGTGRPGGYAERVLVDSRMLFALPDELDDAAAALAEPVAVGVHAVAKAGVEPSAPVVVVGAGPIGLVTALVLRAQGFEHVVLVSRNAARARAAQELGLTTVGLDDAATEVRAALSGAGPAAVFECAGTPSAATLALELVRPLGRVVLVGIALEGLSLPATAIVFKEAELVGALVYRRSEFATAIELLAQGRITTEGLISDIVPLERAEDMFQALTTPGNAHMKVLLQP
jgi:(R,R)-butanediol dehydrogenase / meso-butanediol dehydrogenase / diacetyl reductase